MATATLPETPEKETVTRATTKAQSKCPWIAIVYNPRAEQADQSERENPEYLDYPLTIMKPPVLAKGAEATALPSVESFILAPGANLQIKKADWEAATKGNSRTAQLMKVRQNLGAFVVFEPTYGLATDNPGYRLYSADDAIALVRATKTTEAIEKWLDLETRPEVVEAATVRRQRLEELRKART